MSIVIFYLFTIFVLFVNFQCKMSNIFLLHFFQEHKRKNELLIENCPPEWKSYLDNRQKYKKETFNRKPVTSLSNLYEEFNKLVNSLVDEDLNQFICFTGIQDIIIFDQFMIDQIEELTADNKTAVQVFVKVRQSKYSYLFKDNCSILPDHVKVYIKDRYNYKSDLYLRSKVSNGTFHSINSTYGRLISSLDDKLRKCFVDALMYQDFDLICESILNEFN